MEHDMYPSYWDRRRHHPRHRRPIAFLPSSESVYQALIYAGVFAAGGATTEMAVILIGAGW